MEDREGFVYVAQSGDGLYKIGHTKHPKRRMAQLGLTEIHRIRSDWRQRAEAELHTKYREHWVRGEFFALGTSQIGELNNLPERIYGQTATETALFSGINELENLGGVQRFIALPTGWELAMRAPNSEWHNKACEVCDLVDRFRSESASAGVTVCMQWVAKKTIFLVTARYFVRPFAWDTTINSYRANRGGNHVSI